MSELAQQAAEDLNAPLELPEAAKIRAEAATNFRERVIAFIDKARIEGISEFEIDVSRVDKPAVDAVKAELDSMGYYTSTSRKSQGGPKPLLTLSISFKTDKD